MSLEEQRKAWAHLDSCGACHARFQAAYNLRQSLREMHATAVPSKLAGQLRVMASHERQRRIRRASVPAFFSHYASLLRLSFDNMMRPRALPIAGGLLSAVLLVGMWVPFLGARQTGDDVPLNPTHSEMLRWRSWGYVGPSAPDVRTYDAGDAVIELTIDTRGRVVDYDLTSGKMTPELGQMILLSRFTPATHFGKPVSGKLVYRVSEINVHPIG